MFEKATKKKYRFETQQGALLSVEDLWDLPLQHASKPSLDAVAIRLNQTIKQFSEESFVAKKSAGENELQEKFEIVKHIIAVKQAEEEARQDAAKIRVQNQRIREILDQKKDSELLNKSVEELQAMLKD